MHEGYEPEVWVDLKDDRLEGTEHKYSISSYGRVWNKLDECFVAPSTRGLSCKNNEYYYVNLRIGTTIVGSRVHRIMALSFYGEPPKDNAGTVKKQTCDHIDRNRFNNSLWNLRWLDRVGQMANRDCVNLLPDGTPLITKVREDYPSATGELISFFRGRLNTGYTYKEARELYRQGTHLGESSRGNTLRINRDVVYEGYLCLVYNLPYNRYRYFISSGYKTEDIFPFFKIKEKDFSESHQTSTMWYPTQVSVCRYEGIVAEALRKRLNMFDGDLEQALAYDYMDTFRQQIGEHFMTINEHCDRLQVSQSKVVTYMRKDKTLALEDALNKASKPQRVIKHTITGWHPLWGKFEGEVKRNKAWWLYFGVEPRYGNNRMCKGYTMEEVLTYKGVDTTGLEIKPYTM